MELSFKINSFFICALLILFTPRGIFTQDFEKSALLSIKSALGDHPAFDAWVAQENQTACDAQWPHIACENGVVTKLLFTNQELAARNANWRKGASPGALKGEFPWDAVLQLTQLKVINTADNELTGPVLPENIGSLQQLEELRLNKNNFYGNITSEVTTLVNLTALDLSDNQVEGQIPYDIYKLKNLQVLNLANNRLSSFLPVSLGFVFSLQKLILRNNQLTGDVPMLSHLSNLIFLDLGNNFLGGVLPSNIYNASSLYYFDISYNNLFGSFPNSLINRLNVSTIRVNNNAFSGGIPSSIFNSPSLTILDVSNNFFNGSLPADNSASKIQQFKYDGNCLNGQPNQRNANRCEQFYTPIVIFD